MAHLCRGARFVFRPMFVSQFQRCLNGTHLASATQETKNVPSSPSQKKPRIRMHQIMGSTNTISTESELTSQRERLSTEMASLNSISEVLESLNGRPLVVADINLILSRIQHICRLNKKPSDNELKEVFSDPRFKLLGQLLKNHVNELSTASLLNSLRCLLMLMKEDVHLTCSMESQVLWLMKKMSPSQLFRVVEIHHPYRTTELREEVFNAAMALIEKRWVEISHPKDVVSLMYICEDPKFNKLANKLEEKALDLCEYMDPKDLYRVLYILSRRNHRNTPLLRALVYYMNKQHLSLNPMQLVNLTYSMAKLNLYDTNLLEKISMLMKEKISIITETSILASYLQAFAHLRWRQTDILDVLSKALLNDLQSVSESDLCCLLQTCAALNYLPVSVKDMLSDILSSIDGVKNKKSKTWVDVVWSLCVLQQATPDLVSSVMKPDFLDKLPDETRPFSIDLRLININATCKHEVPGYSGPFLPDDFMRVKDLKVPIRNKRDLHNSVLSALKTFCPEDKYFRTEITTSYGNIIDIELLVNSKGEPQPRKDYRPLVGSDGHTDIPSDFRWVAVKVLDFWDMTLGSSKPTGLNAMAARHISHLGYTLVEVPYTEFSQQTKVVQKVKYLQNQIQQAVTAKT